MAEPTPAPTHFFDSNGREVDDPSRNVLALVDAAIRRQDDLRMTSEAHMRIIDLIRVEHAKDLRDAETARIDAIRAVDIGNVKSASDVQGGVAAALEGKVVATAAAFENRLTATIEPIQRRIDDLTRAQYEQQGQKSQQVEQREKGMTTGMWIGIAVAATGILSSAVLAAAAIAVTFLLTK